jgi:Transcriptional Coactivator p15 (PC4)
MGKRKVMPDELVADSDGDQRPPQRVKTTSSRFPSTQTAQIDDNGDKYWEISKTRRVLISEFKGKKMVNIREYYEKDGKSLPGKKVAKSPLSGDDMLT